MAVALSASVALAGLPSSGATRWFFLALATVAAAYNLTVTYHEHLRHWGVGTMTAITLAGDFLWVTAAALLTISERNWTAIIGYVVVGLECGLLLGAQRRELLAQSASLAHHERTDHLTGLGNSCAFDEAVASLRERPYGLLLIDVDDTRWTNNVYGHQGGDELLHGVARVLSGVCEPSEVAIRMAEDEFALVLPGADEARTVGVAEQVRASMHGVAVSAGRLRVSIGCTTSIAGDDPAVTMSRADDALLAAKAGGGDRVVVHSGAESTGRWRLRAAVETILAAERGVYSVYQRVVRLDDGAIVGWEALSRPHTWPVDVDVEALFQTAHRMGRAHDLDWRCRRNALWEAARLDGPLFVNVNVAGLVDPVHDVDQMLLVCEWAGRAPETVILELSERDAMPDLGRLRRVLSEYRAAGFRFALDDLGEGRTALQVILAARAEFHKLARPLVQAASTDPVSRSATVALVTFSHDIGSTVIAEGLEDEPGRELCMSLHIDLGQGWLFGRPQPADRVPSI